MATWREFGRIGKELRELAPVLLSPDDGLRVEVAQRGAGVSALLKARQGKYHLIAVNVSRRPVEATFRLPDAPPMRVVTPRFETKSIPQIDSAEKTLTMTLPAQSAAIYEVEP